jgi:hypothetical protein
MPIPVDVARKKWQEFKKQNPNFEKSKKYKANFGPLLDQLVTASNATAAAQVLVRQKLGEAYQAITGMRKATASECSIAKLALAAMTEYEGVVKDANDAKMTKAFAAYELELKPVLQAHATNVADELIKSYVDGSGLK